LSSNAIPLSALRPDASLETELRWFFQCADGEMGMRSNWEAYAREGQFLTRRRSTFSVDIHAFHLDLRGAHRELPIRRALQEISADHRAVLFSVYADLVDVTKAWPELGPNGRAELYAAYRDLAGLVPFAAVLEHRRSRTTRPVTDWLIRIAKQSKKSPPAAVQRAAVVREAESRLMAAARAYQSARRALRRPRLRVVQEGA
jgi:hypothetical protein